MVVSPLLVVSDKRGDFHHPLHRGRPCPVAWPKVKDKSGHSKLSTTQIYLHAQEDDLVAAVESVL